MSYSPLQQSHSETLIANALLEYSTDRIVLSFNGGKDCTVLLDLVARVFSRFPEYSDRKIKTVYVRDNEPFSELESFVKSSLKRYPFLQLYTFDLGLKEAFLKFSDDFSLKDYAILIGVRKTDPFCPEVHASDNSWPKFTRIHPILNWDYSDIWVYIYKFNIEYCSLYNFGYTSIGSKLRTFPNPKLLNYDGSYRPASYLVDSEFERLGRT